MAQVQAPTTTTPLAQFALSFEDLIAFAGEKADTYASAKPFPHVVLDDLFDVDALRRVAKELPPPSHPGWTTFERDNEWKHTFDRPEHFGPAARTVAEALNSSEFLRFLEVLTGIDGLISDPHLTSAGYMRSDKGGFLDPHVDSERNPKLFLTRQLNAIVYLNDDWDRSWGGQLELYDDLDSDPVAEVVPVMNRTIIFSTHGSVHGHPKRVAAPGNRSRLCFSAYYYTSPVAPASPVPRHGVLFNEQRSQQPPGWRRAAKAMLPPIALKGARRIKQRLGPSSR